MHDAIVHVIRIISITRVNVLYCKSTSPIHHVQEQKHIHVVVNVSSSRVEEYRETAVRSCLHAAFLSDGGEILAAKVAAQAAILTIRVFVAANNVLFGISRRASCTRVIAS